MDVIPAIDLLNGQCVRLYQGDYAQSQVFNPNPVDMAQNLKKMGASIPGIRPGRTTSEYVERVLNRLTFLGAIFLGLVAIVPTAVESATGVRTFQGLGATSLLILVGVAIDTAKQIQTYVISQRYEGMVKQ